MFSQIVWVEEHDKRSFLLDLMDASGLGAKDLDGEASRFAVNLHLIGSSHSFQIEFSPERNHILVACSSGH